MADGMRDLGAAYINLCAFPNIDTMDVVQSKILVKIYQTLILINFI